MLLDDVVDVLTRVAIELVNVRNVKCNCAVHGFQNAAPDKEWKRQWAHRYSTADEKRKDKSHDVVVFRPEVDVNQVENTKQGEAPCNTIDNDPLPSCGELVDDGAEKEEVNEGPVKE